MGLNSSPVRVSQPVNCGHLQYGDFWMGNNTKQHTIRDMLTESSGIPQILPQPPFSLVRMIFGTYRYHLEMLGPEIGGQGQSAWG